MEIKIHTMTAVRRYTALSLLFSLIATVLHLAAWLKGYDTELGVYKYGAVLGRIAGWTTFAFVLLLATALFTVKKRKKLNYGFGEQTGMIQALLSSLTGGLIAAYSVISLIDVIYQKRSGNTAGSVPMILCIFVLIFAAGSGLYFILMAIDCKEVSANIITMLSFFPTLWFALCTAQIYFDRTSAINGPTKIFTQMALVSLMLFFLTELRVRVGKLGANYYAASGIISVCLGLSYSYSIILAKLFGVKNLNVNTVLATVILVASLYVLTRLIAVTTPPKKKIPQNADVRHPGLVEGPEPQTAENGSAENK